MVLSVVFAVALIVTTPAESHSVMPILVQQVQPAQPAGMTNADVIRLVKSKLGDELIERSMRQSPKASFDLSPSALAALKDAQVSDRIIGVMFDLMNPTAKSAPGPAANPAPATAPAVEASSSIPTEIGVYVKTSDGYTEVDPELVTWRTGGLLKSVVTMGISGGHVNGAISKGTSPLAVPADVEFLVITPEGTSITEYQLLRLDAKGSRREFRALSSGLGNSRSGTDKNQVPFEGRRLRPRVFQVALTNLKPGEYALLPAFTSTNSAGASGKAYTFTVR